MATPLQRSSDGSYGAHLLAGEALWFEARGRGYDYCAVEDLGPGRSAFGEEPLPCPLLPPGRSVDGRVIDEDGAAVADAEIYLDWSQQRSYKRDFTVVAGEESARRSNLLLLLRSDEGGRFYSDRIGGKPPRTSFPFGGFVGNRRAVSLGDLPFPDQKVRSGAGGVRQRGRLCGCDRRTEEGGCD